MLIAIFTNIIKKSKTVKLDNTLIEWTNEQIMNSYICTIIYKYE